MLVLVLGIVFTIMLVVLLYRAAIMGMENPAFTNATYAMGLLTLTVTIIVNVYRGYVDAMETVLAVILLASMFLLKPVVRKLLDLYDLHHQVKPDDRDRIYSKYDVYGDDYSSNEFNNLK